MLRGRVVVRSLGLAVLCGTALAACGSNRTTVIPPKKGTKPPHLNVHMVSVYSSLPERGPLQGVSRQIINGINLVFSLASRHIGDYTIQYSSLNDALDNGWNANRTITNAQIAARDPNAVAYIGDLESGATELSLPILNQAGIVQITPGSGYPGLTNSIQGVTRPNEPLKFYPLYPQQKYGTLVRLIPSETVEARAILKWLQGNQCHNLGIAPFGGGLDGDALYKTMLKYAKLYGIDVPSVAPPGLDVKAYAKYAAELAHAGVGCYVLTGSVTPAAVALTKYIHAYLPSAPIVGTAGFCNLRWTRPTARGVPAYAGHVLYCTSPVLPISQYASSAAKRFIDQYERRYGSKPGRYAIYGYAAAQLVTTAMLGLGPHQDNRAAVRESLTEGGERYLDVLGSLGYSVSAVLPPTNQYQLYNVVDGVPKWSKSIAP